MGGFIILITIIGLYFMFAPEDANNRFNVSLRNQAKFLIGLFVVYAIQNLVIIFGAISLGATFPIGALLFLALDIYLAKKYYEQL